MKKIRCYVKLTLVCPMEEKVINGSKCFDCAHFGGLMTANSANGKRVFVDCGYIESEGMKEKVKQEA